MLPLVPHRALGACLLLFVSALAGCAAPQVEDTAPPTEQGPLALAIGENGDLALTTGTLEITGTCVFLLNIREGTRTLVVWPAARTSWDPLTRTIIFRSRNEQVHRLASGQRVSLGGSGGGADGGEPAAQGLGRLVWQVAPLPECVQPDYWVVGDVVNGA